MKIGAFPKSIGLSAHTLRYHERIGPLPRAPRDGGRRRDLPVRHRARVCAHVAELQAALSVLVSTEQNHDADRTRERPLRPGLPRPG